MNLSPIRKGDNPATDWRKVNDLITVVQTLQSEVRRLSGAVTDLRLAKPPVSSGDSGLIWKGEYSYHNAYVVADVVKISYGAYCGTYVCTQAVGTNHTYYPWLGVRWALLGKTVDQSNWL